MLTCFCPPFFLWLGRTNRHLKQENKKPWPHQISMIAMKSFSGIIALSGRRLFFSTNPFVAKKEEHVCSDFIVSDPELWVLYIKNRKHVGKNHLRTVHVINTLYPPLLHILSTRSVWFFGFSGVPFVQQNKNWTIPVSCGIRISKHIIFIDPWGLVIAISISGGERWATEKLARWIVEFSISLAFT